MFTRLAVLLSTALGCSDALAHHSFAMFDVSRSVTISGTVKTFEWTNPHSWLWLQVPADDGSTALWAIETGSPSMLERRGFERTVFKPGDQVTVQLHPLKDGKPGGNFMKATFPDGRTYAISVGKEEQ